MSLNIKSKVISGIKWTSVSTITQSVAGILKLSVLARFLDKSDFGLMAIVMFILGFMQLFMDMGLSTAILHKQEISKEQYGSLYSINFLFSLLMFAVVLALAKPMAYIYSEPELASLLSVMSVSLILAAIGTQYRTIEQKNLNFKLIAIVIVCASILSLTTAIILAVNGYGVWSLVYSSLIQHIITNCAFFVIGIKKSKLLIRLNLPEIKPFLKIGLYHVGGQIVNYFNRDLDILLVGKFFGTETLGGYSLAKELVFRPFKMVNPLLHRIAAPILAKFQKNRDQLRINYLKALNGFLSVVIPGYLILMILASPVVRLMYGSEFQDIVPLVQILCIYMMFRAIGNPLGSLIVATGRTDLGLVWNLITLIIMPIAVIIGSQLSIQWVAICLTLAMVVLFFPMWWFLVRRMIDVEFKTYIFWLIPGVGMLNKRFTEHRS